MVIITSAGLLLYKVGYGFDPFVHRATEQYIFDHGLITPKPLWYLGQHALVVAFAHLTTLPIVWIDKLLLPILSTTLIAAWLLTVAPRTWHARALLFLLVPLASWFTATTPQGIANLLFLVLILQLLMFAKRKLSAISPALTTAAIVTLHPLTAVPAIILFALTALTRRGMRLRYGAVTAGIAAFILPALFLANEWRDTGHLPRFAELATRALSRLSFSFENNLLLPNSFYAFANAVYTYRLIIILFAFGCALYGMWHLRYKPLFRPYMLMSGALLISAALLYLFNNLSLVISYEQSDYALRTLWLVGFTALPFFWFGGLSFIRAVRTHKLPVQFLVLLALSSGIATNMYFLYPRVDRLENARGYSTGITDLAAVEFIEFQNPEGKYAVLANQSVSAGAMRQLGFKYELKTPDGPAYFYPIPTGGPLYQYFLKMIDEAPTTEVAKEVMDYTGVERVYLVLNNYWWRDYRIADAARKHADWWITLPRDAVTIFGWEKDKTRGWLTR